MLRHTDAQTESARQLQRTKLAKRARMRAPKAKRSKEEAVPDRSESADGSTTETKCRKLRIFPSTEQRATISLWLDGARYAYNLGVEFFNKERRWGRKTLRDNVPIQNDKWKEKAPERLHAVPYKVRDSALLDIPKACAALKAKEGAMRRDLKFRRSKDRSQSFALETRWLNAKTAGSIWAPVFGTTSDRSIMRTEAGKSLPAMFDHDCRLQYERLTRQYYLCIPTVIARAPEIQGRLRDRIVSIDPGIRTFATCYDPGRCEISEFGIIGGRKDGSAKGTELIGWLSRKSDRLLRDAKLAHGRSRRRIKAAASRIRKRIQDLTAEMHHKLALHLCRSYDVVLIPEFSARSISRKKDRAGGKRRMIGRRTARRLMQQSPYRFRQFLIHKAREHGTHIVVCDEYWTSKTCGSCGMLKQDLGGDKVFACKHCGFTCGRDANAARNILLRYLSVNELDISSHVGDPDPGSESAPAYMGQMGLS